MPVLEGIVREVATGCRTKDGALSVLRDLTGRAEKVKAQIITTGEAAIADHQQRVIGVRGGSDCDETHALIGAQLRSTRR